MGWLITLGILTLLAILPLGVSVRYDAGGLLVRLIIGPVKLTLFPRPKKQKESKPKAAPKPKAEPAKPAEEKPEPQKPAQPEKPPSGGPITDFLPLVKTALEMLGAFRRRLRVNLLEVKVILAGDDPCDLALNYGRIWAAIGNLQPRLELFLVIQKRKIEVECDFCASQTLVDARLDLTITLGRILATVTVYGVRAVIEFLKINKKRKGGADK